MKRHLVHLVAALFCSVFLACGGFGAPTPQRTTAPAERPGSAAQAGAAFEDRTLEIVSRAEELIDRNNREGAVLDQRWYGFRRFGAYQEMFLGADEIFFYGGREADITARIKGRYLSLAPLEDLPDPGDIRLFAGHLPNNKWDYIIIGHNGREVALKTIIRLIYMAKFADAEMKQKYRVRLTSFTKSLRVFLSRVSAREEYRAFLDKHAIRDPDAVLIGFMGDAGEVMTRMGFPSPAIFSDETLRVRWYSNVYGKKVLLVSINGDRIYASRSGELIRALYDVSPDSRPTITFLGSGGSIAAPYMIGKIIAPTVIVNGDRLGNGNAAAGFEFRNPATELVSGRSVHTSVESVIVETTEWARQMLRRHVSTVDQELYHVIDAIHSSGRAADAPIYAGILVTDDVSEDKANNDKTLEEAEQTIARTVDLRKRFLSAVLQRTGVLRSPDESAPHTENPPLQ
jgi:hypothetical protein